MPDVTPRAAPTKPAEPERYRVTMIGLDGSRKVVPVITDRGPLKAVYLASSTLRSALAKKVLDVEVEALGRCEVNERGNAKLDGYIFDRQEW